MPEPKSPVVAGLEPYEMIYAKDQPEYAPLPALRSSKGVVLTRWEFTAEERQAIAAGADLFITVHAFFRPVQPIGIEVGMMPEAEQVERDFDLKRELDIRMFAAQRMEEFRAEERAKGEKAAR